MWCPSFIFILNGPPVWRSRDPPWETSRSSWGSYKISQLFHIFFSENPCSLPCSFPPSSLHFSVALPPHPCPQVFGWVGVFFFLFITCFSWLLLAFHFSLLVLYDLLFPFFLFSVMAALPVVLLWGPEFPLANETRAAYLPCFCNPAVSFLKYKLIFIQWSSCAGSDPLRGDCIFVTERGRGRK